MSETLIVPGLIGRTLPIEDLTEMVPSYPDGRRPRARAVAHRMAPMLELVSRGPNGSLSRGAVYRVVSPPPVPDPVGRQDVDDVVIGCDDDWILEQIERMTKGK